MMADTLKIYTKAHGSKVIEAGLQMLPNEVHEVVLQTSNLIINLNNDEWILDDDDAILADLGIGACTVLSFLRAILKLLEQ
jgi:hypothetical protein